MNTAAWTYSKRKPLNSHKRTQSATASKRASDLFDQLLPADDKVVKKVKKGAPNARPKRRPKTADRESSEKEKVNNSSIMLFEECQRRRKQPRRRCRAKAKNKFQSKQGNLELITAEPMRCNYDSSHPGSDYVDKSSDLVVISNNLDKEVTKQNNLKKCGKISSKQTAERIFTKNNQHPHLDMSSGNENMELSFEIPRNCTAAVDKMSMSRLFSASDVQTLVLSDIKSSSFEETDFSTNNPNEAEWVTISCETSRNRKIAQEGSGSHKSSDAQSATKDKQGFSSSKYSYSYASTYSYDTGISTTSNKIASTSPPVLMKKLPLHLNSTTHKDKDNIGTVQFPTSISPIQQAEAENTPWQGNKIQQTSMRRQAIFTKRRKQKRENKVSNCEKVPKCSSKLFGTDTEPGYPSSLDLTAITSRRNQTDTGGIQKDISPFIKGVCKKDSQIVVKHQMKSSSPIDAFCPVSFDLSPIELAAPEDSELGLIVRDSVEVNSSELIVPSLMEPSRLSIDLQKQTEMSGTSHVDRSLEAKDNISAAPDRPLECSVNNEKCLDNSGNVNNKNCFGRSRNANNKKCPINSGSANNKNCLGNSGSVNNKKCPGNSGTVNNKNCSRQSGNVNNKSCPINSESVNNKNCLGNNGSGNNEKYLENSGSMNNVNAANCPAKIRVGKKKHLKTSKMVTQKKSNGKTNNPHYKKVDNESFRGPSNDCSNTTAVPVHKGRKKTVGKSKVTFDVACDENLIDDQSNVENEPRRIGNPLKCGFLSNICFINQLCMRDKSNMMEGRMVPKW